MENMQWQSGGQEIEKRKGKKKREEEEPLYPFNVPVREGRGVSGSRHAGRGLANCVQVRDEPISTRLHVNHRVMG